jgi:hypothetical protein
MTRGRISRSRFAARAIILLHLRNALAFASLLRARVARWLSFKPKNRSFGQILEGLGTDNVGKFYDHSEYFTAIWYNSWPFGIVCM